MLTHHSFDGIKSCDVTLLDSSFSTCQAITGDPFFTGVGLAKNVPRDSLDDFDIELYCLAEGQLVIDPSQEPTGILEGNLELDRVGILLRPGRGITYLKVSPDDTVEEHSLFTKTSPRYSLLQTLKMGPSNVSLLKCAFHPLSASMTVL